ncbi:GNAT family N-acetyltransferase [Bacillus sp. H-16]|uniref:GNAT family N-acetyltransferase n=1 Tax=Alteribacter salitolerans TaxID=2912333 RepID=UPI001964FA54|nr:GNAT family N-acetyltransferase [Alteribacter salitolerans]MBM7095123.1 GNAT family N-acetyltransferase [Alteribacter salitolerans]
MEKSVYLVSPTVELEEEYLSFYEEWKESGEDMIPWVIEKDPADFEEMVRDLHNQAKGIDLKKGWVPDSTFWLVDDTRRVIGAVNIRHGLTEFLLNGGGHIGYGIRPSERRKGYATKLLALSLEKTKDLGIQNVLVVCDEGNTGSLRTIVKNGGIPEKDYIEEDGNVVKRFWIHNG